MGQMFLYDWFLAHNNVQEFTHFTLDDIDAAFDRVQQIKHSQTVRNLIIIQLLYSGRASRR